MHHHFWFGIAVGVVATYAYHKFAPGKGLGQPGHLGNGK